MLLWQADMRPRRHETMEHRGSRRCQITARKSVFLMHTRAAVKPWRRRLDLGRLDKNNKNITDPHNVKSRCAGSGRPRIVRRRRQCAGVNGFVRRPAGRWKPAVKNRLRTGEKIAIRPPPRAQKRTTAQILLATNSRRCCDKDNINLHSKVMTFCGAGQHFGGELKDSAESSISRSSRLLVRKQGLSYTLFY